MAKHYRPLQRPLRRCHPRDLLGDYRFKFLMPPRFALAKAYRSLKRDAEADRELEEFKRLKALEEPARAERNTPPSH